MIATRKEISFIWANINCSQIDSHLVFDISILISLVDYIYCTIFLLPVELHLKQHIISRRASINSFVFSQPFAPFGCQKLGLTRPKSPRTMSIHKTKHLNWGLRPFIRNAICMIIAREKVGGFGNR